MTLVVARFITQSSWSSDSSRILRMGKETSSNSSVKGFLKFQTESIIGAIKEEILLDDQTRWIHEGMMRS
jgi:hypothetical protein